MTFPKISPVDKIVYGGAAVAGIGAYLGVKHDKYNEDTGDKMKAGIAGTAAATAVGLGLYRYGPRRIASQSWGAANAYRRQMNSGLPGWRKYVTAPTMMGAGAVLGAMFAGEDHRTKGAAIGAGVGAAAGIAIHGASQWSKLGKFGGAGKLGIAAGISALAFGAGDKSSKSQAHAAGIANPDTGEAEYVSPEEGRQAMNRGAGRRARNIKADGGLVLGMNRGRHG